MREEEEYAMPASKPVTVTWPDGSATHCPINTPVGELLKEPGPGAEGSILGALVNNEVVSLSYPLEVDSTVRPLTRNHSHGWHIFRDSLCFLLAKAAAERFPEARLTIEHSLGTGLYCTFEREDGAGLSADDLRQLDRDLRSLIARREPMVRRLIPFAEALAHCERLGRRDKANLLRFRNPPKIAVHCCGAYIDIARGPLAGHAGGLEPFALLPHPPGFVLQLPDREQEKERVAPFDPQPHLFAIFREYKQWGRTVNVRTAGDVNELIATRQFEDFVRISEALQEKRVAQIADDIQARSNRVRWVFIAGPSSSGKTTFAKRLAVQMRVNGLRLETISVDDYFVDREQTPRGADGTPDYEHLETIDLELLHEHFGQLDRGEEVELPSFDFPTGKRRWRGHRMRLTEGQVVLVEGIHSLNPRLAGNLPADHRFGIYLSALTQLNLDFENRISTTDNRLLRRMVRDHQFRGNAALDTLRMWPSVRRGEKQWVFPFQQEADVAFSSALDYELPVLRALAEPLLAEVKPYHEEYAVARRLQAFLNCFLSASPAAVPPTSILREFIGQSGFRY